MEHPTRAPLAGDRATPRGPKVPIPRFVVAGAAAVIMLAGLLNVHFGYDVFVPGIAPNAESHITIDAPAAGSSACTPTALACVHRRPGAIHLTTVGVYYGVQLTQLIEAKLNPRDAIYPEAVYPNTPGAEEIAMDASQHDGQVAAAGEVFGYQNLKVDGLLVVGVTAKTPAAKVLQPGDIITTANGESLATSTAASVLQSTVAAHAVGDSVHVTILRGGQTQPYDIGIVKNPVGPTPAKVIGVQIEPDYIVPVGIKIDATGIGGPSAGLSWALAIVNMLGPNDLSRGRTIADTGTIDYQGNVGDIGGIQQKVYGAEAIGATIFVCPKDQAADARAAAAKVGYHLQVIGVSTLHEAVQALIGS